jgi:protein O-GlcNAc transferase
MLDPPHFGGGNTSYEAFAVGTPIVTLPGAYLKSRITRALYAKMGLMDLVTDAAEAYVDLAVRLGTDREFRAATKNRLTAAAPALFEDPQETADFAAFLESIAR